MLTKIERKEMTYYDKIKKAIATLKDRTGSSRQAIKNFIEKEDGKEMAGVTNRAFLTALKKGVTDGKLVQVKGSYKLAAAEKKAPKPKKKKVVKKKKTVVKKKKTVVKKKAKKVSAKKTSTKKKSASKKKKSVKKKVKAKK